MLSCRYLIRRMSTGEKPKPQSIIRHYVFGKYLVVTNTLTCGVLMGMGDALQQTIEKAQKKKVGYDWKRMAHMGAVGILMGPVVHLWYSRLDKVLPGNERRTVVKKVLADQLVASPAFLVLFFFGLGSLEGKVMKDSLQEFKQKFPVMYLVECLLWPPAQAINFYLLPPHLRVFYVNMLILLWDCFLSYMKYRDQPMSSKLVNVHATGQQDTVLPAATK